VTDDLPFDYPSPATVNVTTRRAKPVPDPARQRLNRTNRTRGKRTSHELADYLSGQDVETLGWPWDAQGYGWRLQSKRLAVSPGAGARIAYIEAIPFGAGYLRGFYHVGPRQRLASGTVTVSLREWVEWHGWDAPEGAVVWARAGAYLLLLPLPTFRDMHVSLHGPVEP
jgi:hypothetical protein